MSKKSQNNRINLFIISIVTLLFTGVGLSQENTTAAYVNRAEIKNDRVAAEINKQLPLQSYHSRVSPEKIEKIRDEVIQKLIEEELLYQHAKKLKIKISNKEIDAYIKKLQKEYPSEKAFWQRIKRSGSSKKKLRNDIKRVLSIEKFTKQEITDKISVKQSEVENYYNNNTEKFVKPAQFHVLHILISVNPGAMKEGWLEGQEKALNVRAAIDNGLDFGEAAAQFSADSSSFNKGGDIGWFHQGQLLPELEEAVGNLAIGEMSQPIQTIYGYHLIKLLGKKPSHQVPFAEINQENLKNKLIKKHRDTRMENLLAKLRQSAKIRIIPYKTTNED